MEATTTAAAYDFEGSLLEVCDCDVLCPCWIGEDPDQGECHSSWRTASTAARSAAWTWAA